MKTIAFAAAALGIALSLPAAASAESSTDQTDLDGLELLSDKMCIQLQLSRTMGDEEAGAKIEFHILNHLRVSRQTQGYKLLVTRFWNDNAQHLICDDNAQGYRNPQHFMKRVIDMGMDGSVFDEFLLTDPEEYAITVNHTEIYNGKAETILDFLDNILQTPGNETQYDLPMIRSMREVLIEDYGAKNARDLAGAKVP